MSILLCKVPASHNRNVQRLEVIRCDSAGGHQAARSWSRMGFPRDRQVGIESASLPPARRHRIADCHRAYPRKTPKRRFRLKVKIHLLLASVIAEPWQRNLHHEDSARLHSQALFLDVLKALQKKRGTGELGRAS